MTTSNGSSHLIFICAFYATKCSLDAGISSSEFFGTTLFNFTSLLMCVSLQIFYLLNFIIFVSFSVLRLLLFSEQRFNNLILSKVLNVNLCQKLRF